MQAMALAAVPSSATPSTPTATSSAYRHHQHHHHFSFSPLPPPRSPSTRTLALPSAAADVLPSLNTAAPAALAAAAALTAALSLSDPDRRRRKQAAEAGGDDKEAVKAYFNSTGFDRWRRIYDPSSSDVNRVQLDIRLGHAQTVDAALRLLRDAGGLAGTTVCDAGCGVGSLSIPLSREGAIVSASDISAAMVAEAQKLAQEAASQEPPNSPFQIPKFEVKDLESLQGKYDTVVCLDVLIHYPQEKAEGMIAHLASLAEKRLVLSYAPKTFFYNFLKRVGELFPGPSKATRAYLHAERDVEEALKKVGWRVTNKGFISTQFYFANLIEAVPVGSPQ
ncbi:magnesium protoporphyrin IX methyltransferase, chloroplastic [Typha angustifolia]|uniref:magnesium protoporphyrin IX methyltransferase, chloroplastic n=1 Tax=Typha angustifolia TaxID=59011 RepID=UPI003C2F478B